MFKLPRLNQLPHGARLRLFARFSALSPEVWRTVGSLSRKGGEVQVDWLPGAESVSPAWSNCRRERPPGGPSLGTIEFGLEGPDGLPETIATGALTPEVVQQSRRAVPADGSRANRSSATGPRAPRSAWPSMTR